AIGIIVLERTALEKVMDGIPGQEYVAVRSDLVIDPKTTLDLARNKLMALESSIRHMQTLRLAEDQRHQHPRLTEDLEAPTLSMPRIAGDEDPSIQG
ncbi:hypothetical protein HK102_007696, partial [Quaeritorhiza haematococci]